MMKRLSRVREVQSAPERSRQILALASSVATMPAVLFWRPFLSEAAAILLGSALKKKISKGLRRTQSLVWELAQAALAATEPALAIAAE